MPESGEPNRSDLSQPVSVPFYVVPADAKAKPVPPVVNAGSILEGRPYSPERQRDNVRLILTCGLLGLLGYVVIFATVESASTVEHWTQAKEMLQIVLPAVTGIIGTVIGFYFGTAAANKGQPPDA